MMPSEDLAGQGRYTLKSSLKHGAIVMTESWQNLKAAAEQAFQEGDYEQCEQHWLAAQEAAHAESPDSLDLANICIEMASLYGVLNRYSDAEEQISHALTIRENVLGRKDPLIADALSLLAKSFVL